MRSNKRSRGNDEAQVGIGTMIVFIATVLVAAIAAGVLIDTSGKLQERSSRTGNEATDQVASNLVVSTILGRRDSTANSYLMDMDIFVGLAPGAKDMDLNQTKIQLQNGTTLKTLSHSASSPPLANEFYATAVRDADSSFSASRPVMTSGDLVNITIALDTNSAQYPVRDSVLVLLVPEVGNKVSAGFTTPSSFGVKTVIEIR